MACEEVENELKVQCEPLKQRPLDLIQVAFCAGQEAENYFKMTCEPMKHRFLKFTQVAFWAGEKEVRRAWLPLKTSHSQAQQSVILG